MEGLDTREGVGRRVVPHLVTTEDELREIVAELLTRDAFVVDVETTVEEHPSLNEVLWVGLASYGRVALIPIGHPNGEVLVPAYKAEEPDMSTVRPWVNNPNKFTKPKMRMVHHPAVFGPAPVQLRPDVAFAILAPLLLHSGITKIGHNVKFDIMSMNKYLPRPIPGPFRDTISVTHVLNESLPDYGLKPIICSFMLGGKARDAEVRAAYYPNLGKSIQEQGIFEVAEYLAKDVWFAWVYYQAKLGQVAAENLFDAFDLECALLPVLISMESHGVAIDQQVLTTAGAQLDVEIRNLEIEAWRICGEQFDLSKTEKKRHYLFSPKSEGGQGCRPTLFTDGGLPSVKAEVLEDLAPTNRLAAVFHEWSVHFKLRTAFVDSLNRMTVNGRVYTSFNQHRTVTGRLSASRPNLQQIPRPKKEVMIGGQKVPPPKGTQMREVFIAPPGHTLVVADYDQIELRCIAYLSQDPEMLHLFQTGLDIHREAAASMYGVPPEQITDEMRQLGKTVNFLVGFGGTEYRLAAVVGCSVEDARAFIQRYYQRFGTLQQWKADKLIEAIRRGDRQHPILCPPYVEIEPFGRRRRLPDLFAGGSKERDKLRRRAERQAINAIVQGFASNVMKLALIDLHWNLVDGGHSNDTHIVLSVHDEVMVETPLHKKLEIASIVSSSMESVQVFGRPILGNVPLSAEAGMGDNWLEAK